jgi:hypothetical protein
MAWVLAGKVGFCVRRIQCMMRIDIVTVVFVIAAVGAMQSGFRK